MKQSSLARCRKLTPRDYVFVAAVIGLMTAGHSFAVPYVANQNQYFAHAVGDSSPSLAGDWFISTLDPYPVFTGFVRIVVDLGGITAARLLAVLATALALVAVFIIARALTGHRGVAIPTTAVILVGATLSVGRLGSFIPLDWSVSAFQGFAAQYLLMKPGYFQPSTTGVLVLLAFALFVRYFSAPEFSRVVTAFSAVILVTVAGLLAPTNAVITGMALLSAIVADLLSGHGFQRFRWYVAAGIGAVAGSVIGNPAILALGNPGDDVREALERFAFELFPIHTLVTNWPVDDSTLLLVIAIAVIIAPLGRVSSWISRWILIGTALALGLALISFVLRNPTLALLFPWRVSVIIVPTAATLIAVRVAQWLSRLPHDHWRAKMLLFAAVIAVPGLASSAAKQAPAVEEPYVAAVQRADPLGVGLIPLSAGPVRLNAEVPVYVDAMTPPYAGEDLVEFWERFDNAKRFEADPETFCSGSWAMEIDWLAVPMGTPAPSCTRDWNLLEESGGWSIYQRP